MVKSNRPAARKSSPQSPGPQSPGPAPSGRAPAWGDGQVALLIAALTLGLLLREVVTDLLAGDAGEFQFAAWRWGVAHSTGYPLYLLLGGAWQRLLAVLGVSPAWALNALSAVFAAAAAGLFYVLLRRWLRAATGGLPPIVAGLAAGLGVAFLVANPTLRTQSVQAEVYSLHLLLVVAILLAAHRLAYPFPEAAGFPEARPLILLSLLLGLSLAHHATTLLLLPPLLAYVTLARPGWWRLPLRTWLWALLAGLLPLLLYLYIPLRSGPAASPWYHQRLGDGVLSLYAGGWPAFVDFVSGRSISVGFWSASEAWANAPLAGLLWLRHFEWPGLLLMALGLFVLVRLRQWPLLALTLGYGLLHQVFNLFYAIGDIFVYYLPLYLVGCSWIAFGAAGIGTAFRLAPARRRADWTGNADTEDPARRRADWTGNADTEDPARGRADWTGDKSPAHLLSALLLLILYWLPLQLWLQYAALPAQLGAESAAARARWEDILRAGPPEDAILISNDRNEIVPLFYLQAVEGRGAGMTGLFPLIAPDARFADVGATVQTALDAGSGAAQPQPVYLIKPMPGLGARFALQPADGAGATDGAGPLVRVTGPAAAAPPAYPVGAAYGPLRLLGYDLEPGGTEGEVILTLHWEVVETPAGDYTTTVQLFDAAGEKLAQDDRRAGGDYYPTSLWKPGEVLLDRHTLALPAGAEPVRLLAAMYSGADAVLLAPAVEVEVGMTR